MDRTPHVYLIPGFLGFANLGQITYFGYVRRILATRLAAVGSRRTSTSCTRAQRAPAAVAKVVRLPVRPDVTPAATVLVVIQEILAAEAAWGAQGVGGAAAAGAAGVAPPGVGVDARGGARLGPGAGAGR